MNIFIYSLLFAGPSDSAKPHFVTPYNVHSPAISSSRHPSFQQFRNHWPATTPHETTRLGSTRHNGAPLSCRCNPLHVDRAVRFYALQARRRRSSLGGRSRNPAAAGCAAPSGGQGDQSRGDAGNADGPDCRPRPVVGRPSSPRHGVGADRRNRYYIQSPHNSELSGLKPTVCVVIVLCSAITVYAITDMMMYNHRRKAERVCPPPPQTRRLVIRN